MIDEVGKAFGARPPPSQAGTQTREESELSLVSPEFR